MFRLNRNERSHWSGNGVHVESELVFMIGRNMQHVEVAPDDARCGTHVDLRLAGSPIGELLVYAATREGYVAQREALRRQFQLLEG